MGPPSTVVSISLNKHQKFYVVSKLSNLEKLGSSYKVCFLQHKTYRSWKYYSFRLSLTSDELQCSMQCMLSKLICIVIFIKIIHAAITLTDLSHLSFIWNGCICILDVSIEIVKMYICVGFSKWRTDFFLKLFNAF